jgi:hypothetical protein
MSTFLFDIAGEQLNLKFKPHDAQKLGTGAHIWVF